MYEDSLGYLIWRREGWKDLIAVFKDLKGIYGEDRDTLLKGTQWKHERQQSQAAARGIMTGIWKKIGWIVAKQWKSCAGALNIDDKKLSCNLEWILLK